LLKRKNANPTKLVRDNFEEFCPVPDGKMVEAIGAWGDMRAWEK